MATKISTSKRSKIPGTNKPIPGHAPSSIPGMPSSYRANGGGRVQLRDYAGRFVKGGTGFVWENLDVLTSNVFKVADGCHEARKSVADRLAEDMVAYAKAYASWEDRSGDARNELHGLALDYPNEFISRAYLAHGVDYGIWLEVRWGGQFAIIARTIAAFGLNVTNLVVNQNPMNKRR